MHDKEKQDEKEDEIKGIEEEKYGKRTNRQRERREKEGEKERWKYEINPKGRVGWDKGTSGREERRKGRRSRKKWRNRE